MRHVFIFWILLSCERRIATGLRCERCFRNDFENAIDVEDNHELAIEAVNEFCWFALLALLFSGGPARAFYRRAKVWIDRVMGGVLGLLGLRLIFADR